MCYAVKDIANKLLVFADANEDSLTNMKLQKLLYYQQGYHLAYFGTPLFEEEIEAWQYGPVVPCIYHSFKQFNSNIITGDPNNVITLKEKDEEALFKEVMSVYSKFSAYGLMDMTHNEMPWQTTPVGDGSIISKDKLKEFFKTKLA